MVNQTTLPIDERCPERFVLPDDLTPWTETVPHYNPPIYPEFSIVKVRLAKKGLNIETSRELRRLATLPNYQAVEEYGQSILDLRHPLGRTGINGTGVLWQAGESGPADLGVCREHPEEGRQIALVLNRGRWHLPGGFPEKKDGGYWKLTALREAREETGLDLIGLAVDGHLHTLREAKTKERSSRSADLAHIANPVGVIYLPDWRIGEEMRHGTDAEDAGWFTLNQVNAQYQSGQISEDHYGYAVDAIAFRPAAA